MDHFSLHFLKLKFLSRIPSGSFFTNIACLLTVFSPLPPFIAVSSIKRQHLVEVKAMANPPAAVKLALESICLLLGEETSDWKRIRTVVLRDNFISQIINLVPEDLRYCLLSSAVHQSAPFTRNYNLLHFRLL